jgi:hypothetical protein
MALCYHCGSMDEKGSDTLVISKLNKILSIAVSVSSG